jgi:hypothetical protein
MWVIHIFPALGHQQDSLIYGHRYCMEMISSVCIQCYYAHVHSPVTCNLFVFFASATILILHGGVCQKITLTRHMMVSLTGGRAYINMFICIRDGNMNSTIAARFSIQRIKSWEICTHVQLPPANGAHLRFVICHAKFKITMPTLSSEYTAFFLLNRGCGLEGPLAFIH